MMEEEKKEKEVMEKENPSNKYSDGEQIKNFMKEASSKRDTMGRQVIYTLIAVLWALTYSEENGKITASIWLVISFICGILYVCLDYLYHFVSNYFYKSILKNHFIPEENGGMVYKDRISSKIVDCRTRCWMDVGCCWSFILMLLLFFTAIPLIIHVASLSD